MSLKPLQGSNVVELGDGLAVSMAGLLLAELGAEVRKYGRLDGHGLDAFGVLNRGKTLHEAAPHQLGSILAEGPEVILSGPDWHDTVANAWPTLGARGIVWSAILRSVGVGRESLLPTDSLLAEAASGLMWQQQGHRNGPFCMASPVAAYGAGLIAATGVTMGLLRSARGRRENWRAEVSYLQGALALQGFSSSVLKEESKPLVRYSDPYSVAYSPALRFHRVRDGWVFIASTTQPQWVRLCKLIDRYDFLTREELSGAPLNIFDVTVADEIATAVATFVRDMTTDECVSLFAENEIIVTPALSFHQFLHHPQAAANRLIRHERGQRQTGGFIEMQGGPEIAKPGSTPPLPHAAAPPMEGVHILDISRFVAAPSSARILADLGARVVKVEPLDGDPMRGVGLTYAVTNRGKHSLGLEFKRPEARDILRRLVETADVVIVNALPEVATRLGLDRHSLFRVNPGVVVSNVFGYGSSGPFAGRPVIDAAAQALMGATMAQGGGQEPVGFTGGLVDNGGGWLSTFGITAALYGRQQKGQGAYVETSLLNTSVLLQMAALVDPPRNPGPQLDKDMLGYSTVQRLYQAADGWICVCADSPDQREAFARFAADHSIILADEAVRGPTAQHLEQLFATRGAMDWAGELDIAGFVNWTPVRTLKEVARAGDGEFITVDQPPWGELLQIRSLPIVPDTHLAPASAAPMAPGAHDSAILRALGFSDEELARLVTDGVIVAHPTPVMGKAVTV